ADAKLLSGARSERTLGLGGSGQATVTESGSTSPSSGAGLKVNVRSPATDGSNSKLTAALVGAVRSRRRRERTSPLSPNAEAIGRYLLETPATSEGRCTTTSKT